MNGTYNNISEIVATNKAIGQHFFDPDIMRFSLGRVLDGLYGGRYFITSEHNKGMEDVGEPPFPRLYSVREALPNGSIEGASEHMAFRTAAQAKGFAKRLAEANLPFSRGDTVVWDKDGGRKRTGTVVNYAEECGRLVVVVNTGAGQDCGPINLHPLFLEITHKHGDPS